MSPLPRKSQTCPYGVTLLSGDPIQLRSILHESTKEERSRVLAHFFLNGVTVATDKEDYRIRLWKSDYFAVAVAEGTVREDVLNEIGGRGESLHLHNQQRSAECETSQGGRS